jgi:putative tricarboxylic transport membrane protein
MKKLYAGAWAGIFFTVFGIVMLVNSLSYKYSSNMGPGPGMFPLWLSGILILLSLLSIVQSIKKDRTTFAEILPKGKDLKKLILILAALAGFILIIQFAGFVIAGIVFLFILLAGEYKWYVNLAISIGVSVLLFWVFGILLSVPLPVNSFGF